MYSAHPNLKTLLQAYPQGRQNGHLAPWKLGLRTKNFYKNWNQQLNSN